MRAVQLTEHGGSSVLRVRDVPDPDPGPGEVAVQVRACGVNALDIAVRNGGTETEIPLPLTLGADVAGSVIGAGDGVDGVRAGDRVVINPRFYCGACRPCLVGEQSACLDYQVLGWHRDGGYAERIVVPRANVMGIGDALSFEQAAAAPIAFTTAWRMLVTRAKLRAGERVLIYGASGGVGSAAIEIAKALGARVAAVTSAPAKVERLERLGPELVLVSGDAGFDAALRDWTDGLGVDIVVQTLGGDTWRQSLARSSAASSCARRRSASTRRRTLARCCGSS